MGFIAGILLGGAIGFFTAVMIFAERGRKDYD